MIETPDGEAPAGLQKSDPILLKAIARAHTWLDHLLSGRARTLREVAAREGIEERYVRRMIGAAFLSPDLMKLIVVGERVSWSVDRLAREGLPLNWRSQI